MYVTEYMTITKFYKTQLSNLYIRVKNIHCYMYNTTKKSLAQYIHVLYMYIM